MCVNNEYGSVYAFLPAQIRNIPLITRYFGRNSNLFSILQIIWYNFVKHRSDRFFVNLFSYEYKYFSQYEKELTLYFRIEMIYNIDMKVNVREVTNDAQCDNSASHS